MSSPSLRNLLEFDSARLEAEFEKLGIETYRARQVLDWVYRKRVYDFSRMTNLPAPLAAKLAAAFTVMSGTIRRSNESAGDESVKLLVEFPGGDLVETVFIPKEARGTICVSSQVGCKFHCAFCASGQAGFFRNLTTAEIVEQILRARDAGGRSRFTNVVFMGIGEPLDNYDNVLGAVRVLNDPACLGIGARKITISTCGVVSRMKKLSAGGFQIELSVSLHGASDAVRGKIMPVNRRYPVKELFEACAEYTAKTKREITFEYLLAEGLNASPADAGELVRALKGVRCKVNLIPLNPIPEFSYRRPSNNRIVAFERKLRAAGVRTTVRYSSGADINAACGQLRSVELKKVNGE